MDNRMDSRIEIRCTAQQRKLIQQAADVDKRSVSDWARIVLEREAMKQINKTDHSDS